MLGALPNDYVLYGETFGWVQKLHYEHTQGTFSIRFFDLMVDGQFVGYNQFKGWCWGKNLPIVPEIYVGPWDNSLIEKYINGQSIIADHIREGFVVRPVVERYSDECGRVLLKALNPEYLCRKGDKADALAH